MEAWEAHSPLSRRSAGILLHPTSLPGPWPNGDLGAGAYQFIEFLVAAGHSVWQILPLGPTHGDRSPYQCQSAHAGNPELISIEALLAAGWLEGEVTPQPGWEYRCQVLRRAFSGFRERADEAARAEFEQFCVENAVWLEDFALYRVLKQVHGQQAWSEWPEPLRDREKKALTKARQRHAAEIDFVRFKQFLFFRQWHAFKGYAN